MGNLTNDGAFRDLYTAVFPDVRSTKLDDLIDISRIMARTADELYPKCAALSQGLVIPAQYQDASGWGICSKGLTEDVVIGIIKGVNNSTEILDRRHAALDITIESLFLSAKIMLSFNQYSKEYSNKPIDISGVRLYGVDAKDVDFSGSNISRQDFRM
jgi:hypothetical protein